MSPRFSQISIPQVTLVKDYDINTLSRKTPHSSLITPEIDPKSQFHQESLPPMSVSQSLSRFNEEWDASQRGSSIVDGLPRASNLVTIQTNRPPSPRSGILKRASIHRGHTIKKSSSRRSSRAGSVCSLAYQANDKIDERDSVFFSPVPTNGSPTEILADRFQAWRRVLKDIITYFREIQESYDQRAKSLQKVHNIIEKTTAPSTFLQSSGIFDATNILKSYVKTSISEVSKAEEIENEVILALVGLRSDLQQKIKEIKNLSGDFRNSLEREMENTRKSLYELQDSLGLADMDSSHATGKRDPYLLKLATDHLVEKQIAEENYLHQAYLNLEASGRELEAIIVGEIQKSFNAFANILSREAELANYASGELQIGPISMQRDHEWNHFIRETDYFVDPEVPMRNSQNIKYLGKDDELVQEIRAGLLERKSKYLKSYTAGWYVLTPTHLHEFKSIDKSQGPVMSLNLSEQKLKLLSNQDTASNKFVLRGRQTGVMHRGHSWVFRCENHETMIYWYETLKDLIDKSHQERNTRARKHVRSSSGASQTARSVCSSDGGLDDDEEEPFSSKNPTLTATGINQKTLLKRPQAGGRFPSTDLLHNKFRKRDSKVLYSHSSGNSSTGDIQESNQKISNGISEGEIPSASIVVMNQSSKDDNIKSDSDQNRLSLPETDPNNSVTNPVSIRNTGKVLLEFGDNNKQLITLAEETPEISQEEKNEMTEIDNREDKAEKTENDEILPEKSCSSCNDCAQADKIFEKGTSTLNMSRIESEKERRPEVLRSITEISVRPEILPHVPGEWANEKHLERDTDELQKE